MKLWIIRYRTDPNGKVRRYEHRAPGQPTVEQAKRIVPVPYLSTAEIISVQAAR